MDYPVPDGPNALISDSIFCIRPAFVSPIGFLLLLLGPWVRKKKDPLFFSTLYFFSLLWVVTLLAHTPLICITTVGIWQWTFFPFPSFFVAATGTDLLQLF